LGVAWYVVMLIVRNLYELVLAACRVEGFK
jgi:hypothetical protein